MHRQELVEEIARRKGEKPSPGTIYPALKALIQIANDFYMVDQSNSCEK